eukprot:jgi/Botrbrau1/9596/Bobra.106_2s0018.1
MSSFGCSKCRFSVQGCARCRDPRYQPRKKQRTGSGVPLVEKTTAKAVVGGSRPEDRSEGLHLHTKGLGNEIRQKKRKSQPNVLKPQKHIGSRANLLNNVAKFAGGSEQKGVGTLTSTPLRSKHFGGESTNGSGIAVKSADMGDGVGASRKRRLQPRTTIVGIFQGASPVAKRGKGRTTAGASAPRKSAATIRKKPRVQGFVTVPVEVEPTEPTERPSSLPLPEAATNRMKQRVQSFVTVPVEVEPRDSPSALNLGFSSPQILSSSNVAKRMSNNRSTAGGGNHPVKARSAAKAQTGKQKGGTQGLPPSTVSGHGAPVAPTPAASPPQGEFLEKLKERMESRAASKREGASGSSLAEGLSHPHMACWKSSLYEDPWRLLVACLLLNKTSAGQVRKVIWNLFELMPNAEAAASVNISELEALLYPLGLFRKRALMIKRFSEEYLSKTWNDPQELHGVGQYGSDAYRIFCRGEWRAVQPRTRTLPATMPGWPPRMGKAKDSSAGPHSMGTAHSGGATAGGPHSMGTAHSGGATAGGPHSMGTADCGDDAAGGLHSMRTAQCTGYNHFSLRIVTPDRVAAALELPCSGLDVPSALLAALVRCITGGGGSSKCIALVGVCLSRTSKALLHANEPSVEQLIR